MDLSTGLALSIGFQPGFPIQFVVHGVNGLFGCFGHYLPTAWICKPFLPGLPWFFSGVGGV
jgi:hypothetical protein